MVSFFGQLTKYSTDHESDPRENRLTEALAAVLRKVDGLAPALVELWLDPEEIKVGRGEVWENPPDCAIALHKKVKAAPTQPQVMTQEMRVLDGQRRYIDIEVVFSPADRVRVEVKYGSDPHSSQVEAYEEGLTVPVVILAPARQLPFKDKDKVEAPPSAPQRSWQSTVEVVAAFKPPDEVGQWLCGQFIEFAKEEELMPAEALNSDTVAALAKWNDASSSLNEMVEIARHHIVEVWCEKKTPTSGGGVGIGSWKHFPLTRDNSESVWPEGAWLEFKVSNETTALVDGKDGCVKFIAGLSAPRQVMSQADLGRVFGLLHDSEPSFFEFNEGGCARLMRTWTPTDCLDSADTLEDQGAALGRWAVEAFTALQ